METPNKQILYCKLDSTLATQEYGESTCQRFFGIKPRDFNQESFAKGVEIFTLDIINNTRNLRLQMLNGGVCDDMSSCSICYSSSTEWVMVTYTFDENGDSQLYRSFISESSDAENSTLSHFETVHVLDIRGVAGFEVIDFKAFQQPEPLKYNSTFEMLSFSVGQGMATLIHNERIGYLIDAGAGTPIKRPNYPALARNDLIKLVRNLKLTFFLSHGDSDHWRLLEWDPILRDSIQAFVVPKGLRFISFFDISVKSKVFSISGNSRFQLSSNTYLNIFRTDPVKPSSNNDGLVACFEKADKKALITGDCVYTDLYQDKNSAVKSLVRSKVASSKYAAY